MKHWKYIAIAVAGITLSACTTTKEEGTTPSFEHESEETVDKVVEEKESEFKDEEDKSPEESKPKSQPVKTSDGKLILGAEEWVYFSKSHKTVKARVDSGATTSSLSTLAIKQFERDGKEWVKFKPSFNGNSEKEISLPIERWAKIKQSSSEESDKRPVVAMTIQVGDLKEKTEFTLVDRSHLKYPVLLGRSFVRDVAIVDVSRKYVQPKHSK